MSWDIRLTEKKWVDVAVADIGNYTSNVSKMYVEAMGNSISELDGLVAEKIIPILKKGVTDMSKHPEKYRKLNPPNGWGNYEGALQYLQKLLDECKKNPNSIVEIS